MTRQRVDRWSVRRITTVQWLVTAATLLVLGVVLVTSVLINRPAARSGPPLAVREAATAPTSVPMTAATTGPPGPTRSEPSASTSAVVRHGAARTSARRLHRLMRLRAQALQAEQRARVVAQPQPFSFRVATLNVLGSQHTARRGSMLGTSRAAREAALIESRAIDLIGLQEVQRDQRSVLAAHLPGWTIWPQDTLGRQGYRLQIAWRNSRFTQVGGGSTTYVFDGIRVPLPYAVLKDVATGGEFYVIDAHNSPRNLQQEREAATAVEVDLVNELKATGHPVLLVGDMNEKAPFYCRAAAQTGMVSANGGRYVDGCQPPLGPLRIDWILGTPQDVQFSGYVQDATTRSTRMSDHDLIYTTAQLVDGGASVTP